MTSNQLTEQQIDLLIENGYDIAHTLENLAENEINSDCFEVFSYSENGRETEWDGKITEFAQRAAKAIRHLTDATTALQAELQERRKADREPVAWTWQHLKQWHVTNDEERARDLAWDGVKVDPLYRHAQPAPVVLVVPDEMTPEQAHEIGDHYGDPVDVFARGANWMRQHIIDSALVASPQEVKK